VIATNPNQEDDVEEKDLNDANSGKCSNGYNPGSLWRSGWQEGGSMLIPQSVHPASEMADFWKARYEEEVDRNEALEAKVAGLTKQLVKDTIIIGLYSAAATQAVGMLMSCSCADLSPSDMEVKRASAFLDRADRELGEVVGMDLSVEG
jgi:hypothetical protein